MAAPVLPPWPESVEDLVPLPHCDGPKLKAYDFRGPQKIMFIECIGEGLHAIVFKIKILNQIYALKVFRFVYPNDWYGPVTSDTALEDWGTGVRPLSHYSEPFNAECRAFGRLQEAGREGLAIKCFGYVLLDEEHERVVMQRFPNGNAPGANGVDIEGFNGNGDRAGEHDLRFVFLTADGRRPPLRCIVKEFGVGQEHLRPAHARKILQDIIHLQQLGIVRSDVALRQLIDGKIADFSTAITIPHFLTSPELNSHLTPSHLALMEEEFFKFCISDFWDFDTMVEEWNLEVGDDPPGSLKRVDVWAHPQKHMDHRYNLRAKQSRAMYRVWTYMDPRKYWRMPKSRGHNEKPRPRRLKRVTELWYCSDDLSQDLNKMWSSVVGTPSLVDEWRLEWEIRDGVVFPRKRLPRCMYRAQRTDSTCI